MSEEIIFDKEHNASIVNPNATKDDITNALTRRFGQVKAMCSIHAFNGNLTVEPDYMWAIEGQIDEIRALFEALIRSDNSGS